MNRVDPRGEYLSSHPTCEWRSYQPSKYPNGLWYVECIGCGSPSAGVVEDEMMPKGLRALCALHREGAR